MVPVEFDWQSAKEYCENNGASLLEVSNSDEYDLARGLLGLPGMGRSIFLGGNDAGREGTWRLNSGGRIESRFWARGQPNSDGKDEDCLAMFHDGLHDSGCQGTKAFVCERYDIFHG